MQKEICGHIIHHSREWIQQQALTCMSKCWYIFCNNRSNCFVLNIAGEKYLGNCFWISDSWSSAETEGFRFIRKCCKSCQKLLEKLMWRTKVVEILDIKITETYLPASAFSRNTTAIFGGSKLTAMRSTITLQQWAGVQVFNNSIQEWNQWAFEKCVQLYTLFVRACVRAFLRARVCVCANALY